ncbi:hypothetical protein C1N63_05995 [Pantoea ananatis]|nr:hypothetical protein C1N63_05995 [Pantoea ananatis]PZD59160.1 hypothetical protein ARC311_19560 [Pantoea ananatis]PZD60183.1 hypothetical protein ARC310_15100 [Pantoea ananatis]
MRPPVGHKAVIFTVLQKMRKGSSRIQMWGKRELSLLQRNIPIFPREVGKWGGRHHVSGNAL